MHMLRELILQADEARLGRAVLGLKSGEYVIKVLPRPEGAEEIRAYVGRPGKAVYPVVIGSAQVAFCGCPDAFVKGTLPCKHMLMLAMEVLASRAAAQAQAREQRQQAQATQEKPRRSRKAQAQAAGA
jgi:predicted nucleic acid-binding Zn finger protein